MKIDIAKVFTVVADHALRGGGVQALEAVNLLQVYIQLKEKEAQGGSSEPASNPVG